MNKLSWFIIGFYIAVLIETLVFYFNNRISLQHTIWILVLGVVVVLLEIIFFNKKRK